MKEEICYCTGYGTNVPMQLKSCKKEHWFCNDQSIREIKVRYEDEFQINYYRLINYDDWISTEIFFSLNEKGVTV